MLTFGRHIGWSLGEIARVDPGYLHWLAGHREGGRYRAEIDEILAPMLSRAGAQGRAEAPARHLPLGGRAATLEAGEERRDPVEGILAHRQQPVTRGPDT